MFIIFSLCCKNKMITNLTNKLIDDIPINLKQSQNPIRIDLVLGGGAFNGSYLVGALYFLKEMERRNFIVIERISGCSVGSIAGLLYMLDDLDKIFHLYKYLTHKFKKNHNLSIIKDIKNMLKYNDSHDVCSKINNKLYICYNNIKLRKKIVKNKYKNFDDLCNIIIRSCFIPYLIDENISYENKYIDGITPYFFDEEPNKKILFLDLYTFDKLDCIINIKNEKTNFHRILSGLLEIHKFFIKNKSTYMCSYVNNWSLYEKKYNYFKIVIEKIFVYILSFLVILHKNINSDLKDHFIYKYITKICRKFFISFLDKYCL